MRTLLSANLYALRSARKVSQEAVASAVKISRVAYTRYENGSRIPEVDIAVRLAHYFNVSVEYLMSTPHNTDKQKSDDSYSFDDLDLIQNYRSLTSQGQEYIRQQMRIALSMYKRDAGITVMDEQETE